MSNRQGYTRTYQALLASLREKGKESSGAKRSVNCLTSAVHRHQEKHKRSGKNHQQASHGAPSVSRALPPVGVHSTAEQLLHTTTVCEWLKTVVLRANKHKESSTLRSVIWTR